MRIPALFGSAWLCLAFAAGTAQAEDCGPLKLVASVKMERSADGRVLIPVTINNTPRHMLFDTGGVVTQISPAVVDELKLPRQESSLKLFDVSGNISDRLTVIDSFAIGPLKGQKVQMQIGTDRESDGILTPSLYAHFDVDLDFAANRLNYFLDDHCPGHVTYWKFDKLAVVPMTQKDLHINVPVMVDGHQMSAIIDTGATDTFMDLAVAQRLFGLSPASPGMTLTGYANGDHNLPLYSHVFSSLSFEGLNVINAHVEIVPDRVASKDPNNDFQTGSHVRRVDDEMSRPDVTIGMNVLKHLHIYAAFRERKLYVTAAGNPGDPSPFDPPAPTPPK